MTMPEEAAVEACRYLSQDEGAAMLHNHRLRIQQFEALMKRENFHEIIRAPNIEEVREGRTKVVASDFLLRKDVYYTPRTYKMHLEHMIGLLRQYDKYHVYIDDSAGTNDMIIYVREDIGVLVAKNALPSVLFAINEGKMTAAFWDYLQGFIGKDLGSTANKKRVIERLEAVVQSIKETGA
jgi:hypothetical protein